jgi:hypothetical protein
MGDTMEADRGSDGVVEESGEVRTLAKNEISTIKKPVKATSPPRWSARTMVLPAEPCPAR